MAILRLKYENGQFIPLEPLPKIEEGEIFEIPYFEKPEDLDAKINEMLDRTRGMWADIADEIEANIKEAREQWDEAWAKKLPFLLGETDEWDPE